MLDIKFVRSNPDVVKENIKKKKLSKYEELTHLNEEEEIQEEMEIAYLKKLVD